MTRSLRHRLLSLALCLLMLFQTTGPGALAASLEDTAAHAIGTPSDMEPPAQPEPNVPDDPTEPPENADEPEADGDIDAPEIGDSEPETDGDEPATDDATGEPEAIFGDVNGDGQVNLDDLTLLLTHGYSLAEAQERMPLALSDRPVDISRFEASLWSDPEGTEQQLLSSAELAALAVNGWQGMPAGELCDGALNYRRASFPELPDFEAQCLLYGGAYVTAVREVVIADAQEYLYIATLRYLIFNGQQVPVESFALLGPGARLQIRYIAVATEAPEEEPDEESAEPEAPLHIVLRFEYVSGPLSISAVPYAELSSNAIRLAFGENLNRMIMSYWESGNWVEITAENASGLEAGDSYQFEYFYHNFTIGNLKAADGQMVYDGMPEWFIPTGNGALWYDDEIVADIQAVDGKIVSIFHQDWIDRYRDDTTLSGSFKVSGTVDWHKLPQNGQANGVNGLGFTLGFESNLAQKYGDIHLEKSTPELVEQDGKYYLRYTITITSGESVEIPNVTVKDLFGNAAYIEQYVGIAEGTLPGEDQDGLSPRETSDAEGYAPGSLRGSAAEGMIWDIGALQPHETRALTYCAEISASYVASLTTNFITNRAEAYADDYLKDQSSSVFTPSVDLSARKELDADHTVVTSAGNGQISYKVTITVPESNSFVMEEMTLKDAFPADLSDYLSGSDGGMITVNISVTRGEKTTAETRQVSYADASFTLDHLTLIPGSTVTITYTILVENIFLHNNGDVTLENVVTVGKNGRNMASASHRENLHKSTWARKLAGSPLPEATTIPMDAAPVYEHKSSDYVTTENPGSFDVPKDSIRYQVALNENGLWDLSSTTMTDAFVGDDPHMQYVGYVQIQLYKRQNTGESSVLPPSDEELIAELESLVPDQTVWIKITAENATSFSFHPKDLGLPQDKYAYLLTYYAQPVNMGSVGQLVVSNNFQLKGTVGVGDSNTLVPLPGLTVTVSSVLQGGVQYNASKTSWYYEPYSDLYHTAPMRNGDYPEIANRNEGYRDEYANGALYWVIQLDGDIPYGSISGSRDTAIPQGFYVRDTPSDLWCRRDALIGIYLGPKGFNFKNYASFSAFETAYNAGQTSLIGKLGGNPRNDQWFGGTASGPDYLWLSSNTEITGIVFPGKAEDDEEGESYGYQLTDDQALYIVVRMSPQSLPTGNQGIKTYNNTLKIAAGGAPFEVDTASYTYSNKTSLFKESKGAYRFNKKTGEVDRCSNTGSDWTFNTDLISSSGTYAVWLLNVNWNGSMSGTMDVIDTLPPGMELVYAHVNNVGGTVKYHEQWPETVPISGLGPDWEELTLTTSVSNPQVPKRDVTTITYYNRNTGEIRWRIANLTEAADPSAPFNQNQINLRIVCRVSDPELFLNGSKSYTNIAALLDPTTGDPIDPDSASMDITIPLGKNIDKETLKSLGAQVDDNGNISWPLPFNRLPFSLNINPLGEAMNGGSPLPALIDDLSSTLQLLEDTLEILADDVKYTDYTYTVETKEGHQSLIIYGLPDNTPLTINYQARIVATPDTATSISNKAYWAGYNQPQQGQVNDNNAKYQPSGNIFTNDSIMISVIKVDQDQHAKRLNGAEFEIYVVDDNGGGVIDPALMSGVTDSMGHLTFQNPATGQPVFMCNKVYCIREKTAPAGYQLNAVNDYYFIIASPQLAQDKISALRALYPSLDVWYDSPEYSIVIENPKGTIGVDKVFVDQKGTTVTPTSGTYRFGLFNAGRCLEILTIQYAETQEQTTYLLDGYKRDTATFTKYDPETVYSIYELDENDQPITGSSLVHLDNAYYRVSYSTEDVTAGHSGKITNTLIAYDTPQSLTISKTTAGQGADTAEVFTFTVEIEGLEDGEYPIVGVPTPANDTIAFKGGMAEVKLAHGQSITILCLPEDATYTVTETTNKDYAVVVTGNEGTLASGEAAEAAFVNYRVQPNIAKTVDDTDHIVDIGQELTYTITWSNSTASAAEVTITDELPEALDFVSASGEYTLSADRRTVTWELGMKEPYTSGSVTVTVQVNKLAWNTKITNEASVTVGGESKTPSNTTEVGEGSLTVRKTVLGEGAEADETLFDFTVTLDNQNISGDYGDLTFENGVAHVKLSGGQSAIASGLPSGTGYTVHEEPAEGYRTAGSGTTGVITQNGSATAAFTNTILSRGLRAAKTLTNSGSGAQGAFRAGDTATFDIIVENTGEMTQANVTVTEVLKGATFKPGPGYTVSEDGTVATIAELLPGGRVTVRAEYQVTEADIANPAALENVAVIGGEGSIEQPAPAPIPKEAPDPTDVPTQSPTDAPAPTDTPRPTDEPTVTATSGPTATPSGPTATPGPGQDSTPKTGDDSMLWLWVLMLILSGAGMIVTLLRLRPRKK